MGKTMGLYLEVFQEPLNLIDKVVLNYLLNTTKRRYWSIKETADKLGVNELTISKSLERLEEDSYIKRSKAEGKRYYLTKLTTKALAIIGRGEEETINELDMTKYLDDGETITDLYKKVIHKESEEK